MSADSDLSMFTHPDVAWAAQHMPLLRQTFDSTTGAQFGAGSATEAALRGKRIAVCLHIEPKTAVLCALLTATGCEVWLTGSPGTTRPDVADWLASVGVHVYAGATDAAPRTEELLAVRPDLLLDNGADLTRDLLARGPVSSTFLGGTEETTTGALLLRRAAHSPPFPVIVINDSYLKLLVENRFGVGQSVVQGFQTRPTGCCPAPAPP